MAGRRLMERTDEEKQAAIVAIRAFYEREGRAPSVEEWRAGGYRPGVTWITYTWGSWSNGARAAGLTPRPAGERVDRGPGALSDERMPEILRRLRAGEAPVEVAYRVGVKTKSLRSRVRRYLQANDLPPAGPISSEPWNPKARSARQLNDSARIRTQQQTPDDERSSRSQGS